jgi:hypothetical protein
MRWLMIVHRLPERTRLRTPVLRKDPDACAKLADSLAAVPGVREVAVRPYTGSILVEHADGITADMLVAHVKDALAIERVLATGEHPPVDLEVPPFSKIAHEVAVAVREIDREIRRRSEGAADLGILATLGFFGAGAAEVIGSGRLPLPPWFNLAWWGFRTFMTTEQLAIDAED